jgi:CubicO group peptidase (beta-lactamase class C family)
LLPVYAQDYGAQLAEIDAYAQKVRADWNIPGMAIAIVKDDKVIFAKGYGVKKLESSPAAAYARLFAAVKAKDTEAIRREMSRGSMGLAEMAAGQQKKPIEEVLKNGFSETTFADRLPAMRDLRIKGNFAALEIYNEYRTKLKDGSAPVWDDIPFIFEDGDWKLAFGDAFAGKWNSPGKSFSQLERERNPRTDLKAAFNDESVNKASKSKKKKAELAPLTPPAEIESPAVDENTLFAVASNSKAFTTASLAILIDEGKIGGWDDKVSKYLPEFQMYDAYVTQEMTIRDLVSHRSGLDTFSGDLLWYDTTYAPDEILRRVRFLKPVRGFRAGYGYQNLMFLAAGRIVEKVSGKTWGAFVKERILTPLGMTRTTTTVRDLKENYAAPHNESGGKGLRALPLGNIDNSIGLAGLNSSVSDMAKWIRLQLGRGTFEGKEIFKKERSGEMWQQNIFIPVNPFPAANAPTVMFNGYGMGWFLNDYRGKKLVSHTGGLDGMITQTAMLPSENLGLVVLTNSETGAIGIMRNKILDVFTGAPQRDWNAEALERAKQAKARENAESAKVDAARVKDTKPSLDLKNYAGTYTSEMYGDVTIAEENGKLVMRLVPAPNFVADLEHWHYDTFRIKWRSTVNYNFPRGWVTFTIDKNGKTDQLKIDQPNNDFWFYELDLKRIK